MEVKIEVDDEKLKNAILNKVCENILYSSKNYSWLIDYAKSKEKEIDYAIKNEIKRALKEMVDNHKDEFVAVAEKEARRYLANSCKHPSGTLHKAIEKVLEEYKEA